MDIAGKMAQRIEAPAPKSNNLHSTVVVTHMVEGIALSCSLTSMCVSWRIAHICKNVQNKNFNVFLSFFFFNFLRQGLSTQPWLP